MLTANMDRLTDFGGQAYAPRKSKEFCAANGVSCSRNIPCYVLANIIIRSSSGCCILNLRIKAKTSLREEQFDNSGYNN